ncbi:MAG: PQQ-dependent sugar dehydrogenase, partial [Gemmatimonadetes bacterium]|nr:PQQ-dependent sugar dehydrogenase [Gemmatimonadota bacterium]
CSWSKRRVGSWFFTTTSPTPFLDISTSVSSNGERGLLSVAFHPDYASNGFFFVNYTDGAGDTRIVRYTVSVDPDRAEGGSASAVLTVPQPFSNHNGGQIAFGPDGMLYVGLGDGGSGGDPQGHGQNPLTLLGSMLRIDVDGGMPYSIPASNPFVGDAGAAPESWAVGLRNPWRFSFDRQTGDLYIADVGQSEIEEISVQRAGSGGGENYGWNTMEGSRCFATASCDMTGLVLPGFEYTHAEGCSVTGGYVYRGQAIPSLRGRYLFADFCSPWIRSLDTASGSLTDLFDHTPDFGPVSRIVSFGEDHRGELYVISLDGVVYRIVE